MAEHTPTSSDTTTRDSAPLKKELDGRKTDFRRVLWRQIRGPTPPDLDKWETIRDDWVSEEGSEDYSNWLGGAYMCRFPPGADHPAAILHIEIDITEETYPVAWMIHASPQAPYYPGNHAGKLELPSRFPFEQVYISWLTPIFSPLVSFGSGSGYVSSPFDLGYWTPSYTIQHVLQVIANFLVYDPFSLEEPPVTLRAPYQFHELPSTACVYSHEDKDKFFHAAQFFSRAYNRVGREVDDPPLLESQRTASITAIKELVDFFCPSGSAQGPPIPVERADSDYEAAFKRLKSNSEWILEERIWADALSRAFGFGF